MSYKYVHLVNYVHNKLYDVTKWYVWFCPIYIIQFSYGSVCGLKNEAVYQTLPKEADLSLKKLAIT